jgi:phenylpropionate dioxygenase-like ring-hydroxylating dioxygenase large terminal subunit
MLVSEIPALRQYWYPVARSADIGTGPTPARLLGQDLVLWRPSARSPVLASDHRCPHRGAPLTDGRVTDGCLVCPYHGWRFGADGICRLVPANGPLATVPPRARLASVDASERHGYVWVRLEPGPHRLPDLGPAADWGVVPVAFEHWRCAAPVFVENNLDIAHVPFVHQATMGDPEHPELPPFTVERTADGLRFELTYRADLREGLAGSTGLSGAVDRHAVVELLQPLAFRLDISYANGLRHVIHKVATPIDDGTTLVVQVLSRNVEPDDWSQVVAADRAIVAEDRALLEKLPKDLPLDLTANPHTRADRMTVEYRRLLAELATDSLAGALATAERAAS